MPNSSTLLTQLQDHHQAFFNMLAALPEEVYYSSRQGKWSPALQLDHIRISVQPVSLAFWLPRFMLRLLFGTPNRPSRTYEGLVERYQSKLDQGGRAPGRFVPKSSRTRLALIAQTQDTVNGLIKALSRWDEADWDRYLLPHPLLGKLTLREMVYFTVYHVQHHHALVEKYYGADADKE